MRSCHQVRIGLSCRSLPAVFRPFVAPAFAAPKIA
jgi:hypothetical protein